MFRRTKLNLFLEIKVIHNDHDNEKYLFDHKSTNSKI